MSSVDVTKEVFITGATGILGGWILREARKRGFRVSALMRDPNPAAAKRRLQKVVNLVCGDANLDGIRIMLGDVSEPGLGLSPEDYGALRERTGRVIHCAASVSFEPRQEEMIRRTNVNGVRHMLAFVSGKDIPFYHVSTAYVSGDRTGVCRETELDMNQSFNNAYERSKVESEKLIQQAFHSGAAHGAIFRPSIIVGASGSGKIAQFLNFYGFLKVMDAARSGRLLKDGFFRVALHPECTKNLVPVDWAAAAMWHIIEEEGPSGDTYHLTHPKPILQRSLLEWANKRLDGHQVRVKFVNEITEEHSTLERMAKVCLRHYEPYLTTEAYFDRTNTDRALKGKLPFPVTDHAFFDMLYDYARENKWQSIFAANGQNGKRRPAAASGAMGGGVCAREA